MLVPTQAHIRKKITIIMAKAISETSSEAQVPLLLAHTLTHTQNVRGFMNDQSDHLLVHHFGV